MGNRRKNKNEIREWEENNQKKTDTHTKINQPNQKRKGYGLVYSIQKTGYKVSVYVPSTESSVRVTQVRICYMLY